MHKCLTCLILAIHVNLGKERECVGALVLCKGLRKRSSSLGAKGIATRSKDATRGSWPYYWEQVATRSKDATRAKGIATNGTKCRSRLSTFLLSMPF